jgi:hypothetical protein
VPAVFTWVHKDDPKPEPKKDGDMQGADGQASRG